MSSYTIPAEVPEMKVIGRIVKEVGNEGIE